MGVAGRQNHVDLEGHDPRQAPDHQHAHGGDRACSSAAFATRPSRMCIRSRACPAVAGRPGLHLALHAGARGSQPAGGVPRPRPSAAQGDRGLSARRRDGDGQPQGCARASAGAILVTRLMKRGVAGVVTDGGFRDPAEIARLGFPAYHQRPSAPTNLTLHQAIDINVPIGCGDAPVFPGDTILGDGDGVVVIPANLVDEIAERGLRDDGVRGLRRGAGRRGPRASTGFIRRPASRP